MSKDTTMALRRNPSKPIDQDCPMKAKRSQSSDDLPKTKWFGLTQPSSCTKPFQEMTWLTMSFKTHIIANKSYGNSLYTLSHVPGVSFKNGDIADKRQVEENVYAREELRKSCRSVWQNRWDNYGSTTPRTLSDVSFVPKPFRPTMTPLRSNIPGWLRVLFKKHDCVHNGTPKQPPRWEYRPSRNGWDQSMTNEVICAEHCTRLNHALFQEISDSSSVYNARNKITDTIRFAPNMN